MEGYPVKVYIYDISKGLARNLSMGLLGKQIDGVWHTGIVVYGTEYYFGGGGIETCQPMGTILGQPDSIKDLGTTQVPPDVFMDHLAELSVSSFRPECYHLLEHNCNTFSSEIGQFLTGNDIPAHITNLPAEVMSSPFGQMLKPLLDSMSVSPEGGHKLFSQGQTTGASPGSGSQGQPKDKPASSTSKSNMQHSKTDVLERDTVVFTTTVKEILDENKVTREGLKSELPSECVVMTEAAVDILVSTPRSQSTLRPEHIQTLGKIVLSSDASETARQVGLSLLQVISLSPEATPAWRDDPQHTIPLLLQSAKDLPLHLLPAVVKTMVNCSSTKSGHQFLTSSANVSDGKVLTTNLQLTTALCVHCLLVDQPEAWVLGASLVTNLLIYGVNGDTAVELASAVLQCLTKELSEKTANLVLWSLVKLMRTNEEVRALTGVMGVDWDRFSSLSPSCHKYTQEAHKLLSN